MTVHGDAWARVHVHAHASRKLSYTDSCARDAVVDALYVCWCSCSDIPRTDIFDEESKRSDREEESHRDGNRDTNRGAIDERRIKREIVAYIPKYRDVLTMWATLSLFSIALNVPLVSTLFGIVFSGLFVRADVVRVVVKVTRNAIVATLLYINVPDIGFAICAGQILDWLRRNPVAAALLFHSKSSVRKSTGFDTSQMLTRQLSFVYSFGAGIVARLLKDTCAACGIDAAQISILLDVITKSANFIESTPIILFAFPFLIGGACMRTPRYCHQEVNACMHT